MQERGRFGEIYIFVFLEEICMSLLYFVGISSGFFILKICDELDIKSEVA